MSAALADIWTALNANGPQDAVFWTQDQMFQWFDQAAKALGRTQGVFVDYLELTSVTGQQDYDLPDVHISTIQAALNGLVLRARNVEEAEAFDSNWVRTTGAPYAFLQDVKGVLLLSLQPIPELSSGGLPIQLTVHTVPDTITQANAFLRCPQVIREYFTFTALAEARIAETHAQMPEAAQFFGGIRDLMTQAIDGYWGRDDG